MGISAEWESVFRKPLLSHQKVDDNLNRPHPGTNRRGTSIECLKGMEWDPFIVIKTQVCLDDPRSISLLVPVTQTPMLYGCREKDSSGTVFEVVGCSCAMKRGDLLVQNHHHPHLQHNPRNVCPSSSSRTVPLSVTSSTFPWVPARPALKWGI